MFRPQAAVKPDGKLGSLYALLMENGEGGAGVGWKYG